MIKTNLGLYTDFYEFSMAYAYFKENKQDVVAYFDMFVRKIPENGGYMIFNGLHQLIENIKNYTFTTKQIDFLRETNVFDEAFLDYLANLTFDIDMWAMPEGTVCFANEPLITIKGSIIQAQLIETMLLASVNYPILVATKAARIAQAANNRAVVEFGARRAHSMEAAIIGSRAALIGGFIGTSNTLAGYIHDIPISGTIAHSYIQMHDNEYDAFLAYCKINPNNAILLVDTYDTLRSGVVNAIKVAYDYLIPNGYRLKAIRLDSGDLAYLSKKARMMLDEAGLHDTKIWASNSLDEHLITDLINQDAKIDAFGIGENFITSKSQPVLSGVYKLVAHHENGNIIPKIKISDNLEKILNPGFKKLVRFYDKDTNIALGDCMFLADEEIPQDHFVLFDPMATWKTKEISNYIAKELLVPIFVKGKCVYQPPSLQETIAYTKAQCQTIWQEVKRLYNPHKYYVDLSVKLYELKQELIKKNQ